MDLPVFHLDFLNNRMLIAIIAVLPREREGKGLHEREPGVPFRAVAGERVTAGE